MVSRILKERLQGLEILDTGASIGHFVRMEWSGPITATSQITSPENPLDRRVKLKGPRIRWVSRATSGAVSFPVNAPGFYIASAGSWDSAGATAAVTFSVPTGPVTAYTISGTGFPPSHGANNACATQVGYITGSGTVVVTATIAQNSDGLGVIVVDKP